MIHRIVISFDDEKKTLGMEGLPGDSVVALGILQTAIALAMKSFTDPVKQSPIMQVPHLGLVGRAQ